LLLKAVHIRAALDVRRRMTNVTERPGLDEGLALDIQVASIGWMFDQIIIKYGLLYWIIILRLFRCLACLFDGSFDGSID
jgi:hypothetical protein